MEYSLFNSRLSVTVSSRGAELQSIRSGPTEYLWGGSPELWPDRSPLLFPFVGRLTDGRYCYRGAFYPMEIHGFARKMDFSVSEHSADRIEFMLRDSEETNSVYPFRFILRVRYRLSRDTILVRYIVENQSEEIMYFGIGGHPGFRVPLEEGMTFSDYCLEFSSRHTPTRVGHTASCFLSGEDRPFPLEDGRRIPLRHSLFDEDAVVLKDVAGEVTLKSKTGERAVRVSYPDMPYLGLWHVPHTEAPYLCIEPWTSLPSRQGIVEDLQAKSDLIRLDPRKIYRNRWQITVF